MLIAAADPHTDEQPRRPVSLGQADRVEHQLRLALVHQLRTERDAALQAAQPTLLV